LHSPVLELFCPTIFLLGTKRKGWTHPVGIVEIFAGLMKQPGRILPNGSETAEKII